MAEPLSIAASVVGLLTAAAQVSQVLSTVINKARHAPESCAHILREVDDIRRVLAQLQQFILGTTTASPSRTSLIMLEQIIAALASCVMTFSDLDVFAESLQSEADMGLLDRLRWVSKEADLKATLARLQGHKSSLSLMLMILTCQKQTEAEDKVDRLCDLVQSVLEQHSMLAERLRACNSTSVEAALAHHACAPNPQDDDHLHEQPARVSQAVRGFAFEDLLMSSRPYRKAANDYSDAFSVISSAGRTASWSILSGLSLSEISNIAILAIPVYAVDIANREAYNFEAASPDLQASAGNTQAGRLANLETNTTTPSVPIPGIVTEPRHHYDTKATSVSRFQRQPEIFREPLVKSIKKARAPPYMREENGKLVMHKLIPIIVSDAGTILKGKAAAEPNIFATPGNSRRMMSLEKIFSTRPWYGKDFTWVGYTVHDAAGILLRYLKTLPEPIIPYSFYQTFTAPLRPLLANSVSGQVLIPVGHGQYYVEDFQRRITKLPPPNKQLLIYLLDVLAVIASKSALNGRNITRLVGHFQPAFLAAPPAQMNAEEHTCAAMTMEFLVENNDSFLSAMPGTVSPAVSSEYIRGDQVYRW